MSENTYWYDMHDNIVRLANYMADEGATVRELLHFIEKPWQYGDTYAEMITAEAQEEAPV